MTKKKVTLETIATQLQKMDERMDRGFGAVAEDISKLATKDQVLALHVQVNSIEGQLKETRTEARLGNLEEKVFGAARR